MTRLLDDDKEAKAAERAADAQEEMTQESKDSSQVQQNKDAMML